MNQSTCDPWTQHYPNASQSDTIKQVQVHLGPDTGISNNLKAMVILNSFVNDIFAYCHGHRGIRVQYVTCQRRQYSSYIYKVQG